MPASSSLLDQAIALHDSGQLDEAAGLYGEVLRANPREGEALFRLGRLQCQKGQLDEGARLLAEATQAAPQDARAFDLLGLALERLGRLTQALAAYDQAIALAPENPDAWDSRAGLLGALGRRTEALRAYDESLRLAPRRPEGWLNRGALLQEMERHEDAIKSFDTALAMAPGMGAAHLNRGVSLSALMRYAPALAAFEIVLTAEPDNVDALSNTALALRNLDRPQEGLELLDRALARDPAAAQAHANRASVLLDLRRFAEGVESATRAVELAPDRAEILYPHALLLSTVGRHGEAIAELDRALARDPAFIRARILRAQLQMDLGRLDAGRQDLDTLVQAAPPHPEVAFLLATARLRSGDWMRGLPLFERRNELRQKGYAEFPYPRWTGDKPDPKSLLVLQGEQGRGDIIQFARFAPLLTRLGHKVALATTPEMLPLLSGIEGIAGVMTIEQAMGLREPARWAPLMSVPHLLHLTPQTLPPFAPYLKAQPARTEAWRQRLGESGFKIAVAWAGNPKGEAGMSRAFPLAALAPVAALEGVRIISLQKGPGEEQAQAADLPFAVEPIGEIDPRGETFLDSAAILAACDLVISCDTAMIHLAGALGRPALLALIAGCDWRWLAVREDTPWYPSVRLFRQDAPGDWSAVFARMADEVKQRMVAQAAA
ncbi:tetratricopeptide repeat protein [Xanthobacter sp. VTT E-85241]|uniref:tetratricopeptide repeat protein n=1 Tax=Roseixanthobacter finlandensis TaxID=3119922 RepID=UPI00372788B6